MRWISWTSNRWRIHDHSQAIAHQIMRRSHLARARATMRYLAAFRNFYWTISRSLVRYWLTRNGKEYKPRSTLAKLKKQRNTSNRTARNQLDWCYKSIKSMVAVILWQQTADGRTRRCASWLRQCQNVMVITQLLLHHTAILRMKTKLTIRTNEMRRSIWRDMLLLPSKNSKWTASSREDLSKDPDWPLKTTALLTALLAKASTCSSASCRTWTASTRTPPAWSKASIHLNWTPKPNYPNCVISREAKLIWMSMELNTIETHPVW